MFTAVGLVVITLSVITGAGSQERAASLVTPLQADIDVLVTHFVTTAEKYQKVFLNLTAEETRLVEIFDQSGRLDKRREIVSDLVVYEPSRDSAETTEYRDVRSVDGKPIKKQGTRALDLLRQASQSNSIKKELEIINRESGRYDLNYRLIGATNQYGLMLQKREKFRVEWAGRDQVGGHDVVVLDYQQLAPSREGFNPEAFKLFGFSTIFSRGRLWIDAATSQLRQERWELAGIHPALREPVTFLRREATYTESPFGILVPESVAFDWYWPSKHTKNELPSLLPRSPRDMHLRAIQAIPSRHATNHRSTGVAPALKPDSSVLRDKSSIKQPEHDGLQIRRIRQSIDCRQKTGNVAETG